MMNILLCFWGRTACIFPDFLHGAKNEHTLKASHCQVLENFAILRGFLETFRSVEKSSTKNDQIARFSDRKPSMDKAYFWERSCDRDKPKSRNVTVKPATLSSVISPQIVIEVKSCSGKIHVLLSIGSGKITYSQKGSLL
jgi:hypothetical protein